MPTEVKLSDIRTDGGTQMRAEIDKDVYMDYRDQWLAGAQFDPIIVYHDGVTHWLADGFHRFYGAREAKLKTIRADVRRGTQRDAILCAAGANATHGLRRTNEDKRRAVEALLNDEEWCKWSDNRIAETASVSQPFVGKVRKEVITVITSPAAKNAGKPRVGKDGKQQPASKPKRYNDTFNPKELESPAQKPHRADADMPPSQVDETGAEVPKSLIGVFEKRGQFQIAAAKCREAAGIVAELKRSSAGRELGDIGDGIIEAAEWIEAAAPHSVSGRTWVSVEESSA